MKAIVLGALRIYKRWVSPVLPPSCRFTPTCSEYAAEAIARYGVLAGSARAAWRLLRCHPFCKGGYDPVSSQFPVLSSQTGQARGTGPLRTEN